MDLKAVIRNFPDFPKKGILFRDISPILKNHRVLRHVTDSFVEEAGNYEFELVAGIESRGFIFSSILAYALGKGLIPVRKAGKLPGRTVSTNYTIEYGEAVIEMQEDAVSRGEKVLLVDDLLATGGTALASAKLIEKLGGIVVAMFFVIELKGLRGRELLEGYKVYSLVEYE